MAGGKTVKVSGSVTNVVPGTPALNGIHVSIVGTSGGHTFTVAKGSTKADGTFSSVPFGPTPAADPVSPPRQGPEKIDLERAIRELPDGYREVLILHDVEGLTHEEVGGRLGIDAGTSKSQLSRARRALRAYWAGGKP